METQCFRPWFIHGLCAHLSFPKTDLFLVLFMKTSGFASVDITSSLRIFTYSWHYFYHFVLMYTFEKIHSYRRPKYSLEKGYVPYCLNTRSSSWDWYTWCTLSYWIFSHGLPAFTCCGRVGLWQFWSYTIYYQHFQNSHCQYNSCLHPRCLLWILCLA